jgi:benzoyl-CoA reductase subunit C
MFDVFQEWYDNRHDYARDWKKKHPEGKVLGFFCTYAPEELLYAADILPVRVLGSHEPQSVTEPHIFGMYCPFCRDCLAQGLQGRYDYLDGIIESQSCLHLRQAFTSWKLHIPTDFAYYLPMPHGVQSPRTYDYLAGELNTLKEALEKWIGRKITDSDLDRGIDIVNTNRRLMRKIYEQRKLDMPPLSGLEALYMVTSSQMVDKREHNAMLEEALKRLPERTRGVNGRYRLMTLGSENDDVEFVRMVESLNATVVIDEHCTGTRYFWNEVEPGKDRLRAIAARYIDRPACPSKDWPIHTRIPHIVNLAKEWNVAGVLLMQQKFCDPHEFDIPIIGQELKKAGIPTYFLELDATLAVGQFKIRVEAFLEMLGADDLF